MGGNPNVVTVSNFFSNATAVAVQSVILPFTASSAVTVVTDPKTKAVTTKVTPLSSAFKMVFWTVVAITVGAGIAHVILAGIWEKPTPNQQSAFEAMGFAWKAGIGAIFGLLGGKAT